MKVMFGSIINEETDHWNPMSSNPIMPPSADQSPHIDFDMRFTYVSTGQSGSMHDTSVLYNALSVDKDIFPHPPQGNLLALTIQLCFTYHL
jgi:hypothetical protein